MPSPLAGRVVLVTGASSGVGEASAKAIAERGATVLCVARRQGELDRVVGEIEAAGGSAYGYACDLTDAAATDALVERVLREHESVDMLVNNAGRSIRRSLEFSYDRMHDFERTMAINYFGPVRLILGLLPADARAAVRPRGQHRDLGRADEGAEVHGLHRLEDGAGHVLADRGAGDLVRQRHLHQPAARPGAHRHDRGDRCLRRAPAKSPEQAAALVVRALEDRPVTISTVAGRVGEVLNLVAPRLSDAAMGLMAARMPDSPAARAHVDGDAPFAS